MSTIVLPNLPEQTQMQTPSQSSPQGVKRPLDATVEQPAAKKQHTTKRIAPKFIASRYNWTSQQPNIVSKKDKDGKDTVQLTNSSKIYGYQVHAPPGIVKFCNLGEGGNIGKFNWCATEKSASIGFQYTNAPLSMRTGESVSDFNTRQNSFKAQQDRFFDFLRDTHKKAFDAIWETIPDIKNNYVKKSRAVLPKDSDEAKIQSMARKLFDKFCSSHTPMKEDGQGGVEFQIKCGAYIDNKNGTFTPRDVNVYDGNTRGFPQHETMTPGKIVDGAILSPVFAIRVYQTPGNASFGITYQLENRFVIFHKQGTGSVRSGGPLRDDQLQQRQYQFKGVTSKSGKYNIYVNDLNGASYKHRIPNSSTKYCDLVDGTLGKFPGVTEDNAKFTITFLEDENNAAYLDHVEALVRDAATYLFNDTKVLKDQKAELRATAQEVANETGQSVDAVALSLFMENIQSPISNKGNGRELRCTQRMHKYRSSDDEDYVKNTFKYRDEDCDPMEDDPMLEPGCTIAPVLSPEIYVLATGIIGVSMKIDMDNYIHVASGAQAIGEGGEAPVYSADMF